jgi:RNA polymerase sigma-70 factor (ECF subfamily)
VGDSIDAERLLAHASFVRGLARSLLLDEHRADDIVQETFLAAIRRPPRQGVDVRAWLGGVVRNLALKLLRTEGRLARRHRSVARNEAAQLELERRIVEAVLALDKPHQTAIYERFYEDLTPSEAARRRGIPVGTGKTRLKRALQQLRARLGEASRAGLMVIAYPGLRTDVNGVLVLSEKAKLVAATLVAITATGAVWYTARQLGARSDENSARMRHRVEVAEPDVSLRDAPFRHHQASTVPQDSDRRNADAPVGKGGKPLPRLKGVRGPAGTLAGRVIDSERSGVPGVSVVAERDEIMSTALTDAEGRFRMRSLGNGEFQLGFAAVAVWGKTTHTFVRRARAGTRELQLPFHGVAGVLLDEDGMPQAKRVVYVRPEGESERLQYARTTEEGHFAFYGLPDGAYRLSSAPALHSEETFTLEGGAGLPENRTGLIVRVVRGLTIEGIVLDEKGRPVPKLWVRAQDIENGARAGAYTNADGRFVIKGLEPRQRFDVVVRTETCVPETDEAVPAGTTGLRFKLARGLEASGSLLEADGRPVAKAWLTIMDQDGRELPLMNRGTDEHGRFKLAGLPAGHFEVKVGPRHFGTIRDGDRGVALRVNE